MAVNTMNPPIYLVKVMREVLKQNEHCTLKMAVYTVHGVPVYLVQAVREVLEQSVHCTP